MVSESYEPETVNIRAGQTVEWRNSSREIHTVTDDPKVAKDPKDAIVPPGAHAFDSGDIPAGQGYMHTFTVPGAYRYFCRRHEDDGMVGSVVVAPVP